MTDKNKETISKKINFSGKAKEKQRKKQRKKINGQYQEDQCKTRILGDKNETDIND